MTSKLAIFNTAADLLDERGYEAEVRENYSGRGMYGNTTPAIVTGASGPLIGAVICAAYLDQHPGADVSEALDMIPYSTDSIGLDKVFY